MAGIASLVLSIGTDVAKLVREVDTVNNKLDGISATAGRMGKMLAGAFTIGAAVTAINQAIEYGGAMTDLAAQTGFAVEAAQELKHAAEQNGSSLESVAKVSQKLAVNLAGGNGSALSALKFLGVGFQDLRSMAPEDQFTLIAEKLKGIEDPGARAKLAFDLMGKGAADVLPLINAGVGEARDKARELGLVLSDETVSALDDAGDAMDTLKTAGLVLVGQVIGPMLPALTSVASMLSGGLRAGLEGARNLFNSLLGAIAAGIGKLYDFAAAGGDLARTFPGLADKLGITAGAVAGLRAKADEWRLTAEGITAAAANVSASHEKVRKVVQPLAVDFDKQTAAQKLADKAAREAAEAAEKFRDSVKSFADQKWFQMLPGSLEDTATQLRKVGASMTDLPSGSVQEWARQTAAANEAANQWAFDMGAVLMPALEDTRAEIAEAAASTSSFGRTVREGFSSVLGDVPNMLAQAFTGGGGLMGAVKAIGTKIGSSIGGGIGEFFGGPLGGQIGSAIGSMVGPLISKIAGLFGKPAYKDVIARVGHGWGVSISENLAKGIADTAKTLFRGDRGAAELFSFDKILGEAGGLSQSNVNAMTARLRDVFVMVETGKFSAQQATDTLQNVFGQFAEYFTGAGQLAAPKFLEIIELSRRFGLEVPAISEHVQASLSGAVGGLQTFLENATVTSQAAADGMSAAVVAAFGELTRQGVPAGEAIGRLAPVIDSLAGQLAAAGLEGGEAFAEIRALSALASSEIGGPAVAAVGGLNQTLIGLHNAGLLNQTMFGGLSAQVSDTFNRLIEGGANGDQAMRLMGPTLQTIWALQKDFGYVTDESTAALLEQAAAAGVVGDQHRSAQDRMVAGIEAVVGRMDVLISRLGGVGAGAGAAAGAIEHAFRNRAIPALEDTAAAVADVIEMHSPTGLEGIAHYSIIAATEMEKLGLLGSDAMDRLKVRVKDTAGAIAGDVSSAVQGATAQLGALIARAGWSSNGAPIGAADRSDIGDALNNDLIPVAEAVEMAHKLARKHGLAGASQAMINQLGQAFGYNGEQYLRGSMVSDFLGRLDATAARGFALGTAGRFVNFGAGTPVVLHGRERVMTENEGRAEAATTAAMAARLDEFGSVIAGLPRQIGRAVREAVILGTA
jgi:hypothetical protein